MCSAPVGDGAKRRRGGEEGSRAQSMLIGAHVSTAGGLANAVERGVELDCDAIQIFHQSPRMWRPTAYSDEDFAAFRDGDGRLADRGGRHPRRLPDQLREQGARDPRASRWPRSSRRCGWATGSAPHGVVLHAGARKGEPHGPSVKRAGKVIREALAELRSLPAPAREHRRHPGPAGQELRRARRADRRRGRRQAGSAPASTAATCSPPGSRSARARRSPRCSTSTTPRSGSSGSAASTSTTPRSRSAPTATSHANLGEGELGAQGAARRSCRSRASRACRR